jgi:hypothetical protein
MEASEAQEHLEVVDRIIAVSSKRLYAGGEFFLVWGLAGAILDVVFTLVAARLLPPAAAWMNVPVLLLAIGFTVLRTRFYRTCSPAMSYLQREYLNVLQIAIAVAVIANVLAFNVFAGIAALAIWNIVESIVLAYVAIHGNVRARVATVVLLLSIAIANFVPQYAGYILAAGVLVGYAGFGAAELLARD